MGYMMVIGDCVVCGILFSFNPDRVPSIRIDGEREPVCRDCVERANRVRAERGLPLLHVLPEAYEPLETA